MHEKQTLFIEIIMGVILGAVLVALGEELTEDFTIFNYHAVLLVIGLLIFAELYLWLDLYHETLEVDYAPLYMYFDIMLGMMFVVFVLLIRNSADDDVLVAQAMILCAVIFILLSVRNYIPYRSIQDLETKLQQARINKFKIRIPMISNIVGCLLSIIIFYAAYNGQDVFFISLSSWVWIAFVTFLIYATLMHVFKLDISLR